jgi:DNA polymerase I-like protein with 3'-5' exonuclease and polymerase domains
MYLLERWITSNSLNARLLMQVHDSIALEFRGIANAARVAKQIARIMERDVLEYIKEVFGIRWDVPLQFKVSYGERWQ